MEALPPALREHLRRTWVTEAEAANLILRAEHLAQQPASHPLCEATVFHLDRDGWVYFGGACDSGGLFAAVPQLRPAFRLGRLTRPEDLPALWAHYHTHRPKVLRRLDAITWGELARRYADPHSDALYWLYDLPSHKWAAAYLLETLPR